MAGRRKVPTSHSEAVKRLIREADWLSDEDAPALTALQAMATELDQADELKPPLMAQYQLTYRNLIKRAPAKESGESDPVEDFLDG